MIHLKRFIRPFVVLLALTVIGCATISYKPPIPIPVKLVVSTSGEVKIVADNLSYATPIGTFSVGAYVPIANFDPNEDVVVILQDRRKGTEQVFKVVAGRDVRIVTNGTTEVRVGADRRVTIDITDGVVELIEINAQRTQAASGAANPQPISGLPPTVNVEQTRVISNRQTATAIAARQTEISRQASLSAAARPTTPPPPTQNTYYSLANKRYSSLCLGVQNNSMSDGAFVEQRSCSGAANQSWGFQDMGGGYYQLIARSSGKCMTVQDGSTAEWALIVQQTCIGASYQQWSMRPYGGYVQLVARHSGQCIDEDAFNSQQGLEMQQGPCGSSDIDNQLWQRR